HRIQSVAQHRGVCIAVQVVVYIHAVQRHVGLVGAAAADRALARVAVGGSLLRRHVHRSRLQAQQIDDVTSFERKLLNLVFIECVAYARIAGVEGFGRGPYLNRLALRPDLQLQIDLLRGIHEEFDALARRGTEARRLHLEVVNARRQRRNAEITFAVGVFFAAYARLLVGGGDLGAYERGSLWVGDLPEYLGGARLSSKLHSGREKQHWQQAQVPDHSTAFHEGLQYG